jgi:membrane protease YdiL (CAAX protease family)
MLSDKPWKAEAFVRLFASVMIAAYAGSLLVSTVHVWQDGVKVPWFFLPLTGAALLLLAVTLVLIRKPWQIERFMARVIALLVCFYIGFFIGFWVHRLAGISPPSARHILLSALALQGAALVLIAMFVREHHLSWGDAFGLANSPQRAALWGIIAACIFVPCALQMKGISFRLLNRIEEPNLKPEEQQAVQALTETRSWWARIALGVVTILLAPVAEETFFRGIMYPVVKRAGYPRLALWGTSLLFAAIHVNLITFLPLFVLAMLLTLLYERTDNLLAPITAHSLFNAMNFILLYVSERAASS